jgi:hypothetical protein
MSYFGAARRNGEKMTTQKYVEARAENVDPDGKKKQHEKF